MLLSSTSAAGESPDDHCRACSCFCRRPRFPRRGAQASEVIHLSAACVTQRLSYNARLSELGRQGVWIGFAVIDDGGDAVEMTPSRDVLAYPKGDFDFSLPPGDYRLRVQGRGAEWAYTLECLPGD